MPATGLLIRNPVRVTIVGPSENVAVFAPGTGLPFSCAVLPASGENDDEFTGPKTEIPGVTSLLLKNKLSANREPVPGSAKTLKVYDPGSRLTLILAAAAFPVLMNPVPLSRYRLKAPSPPKVFQDCPPEFPDALASVRMAPVRVVALPTVGVSAITRAHARVPAIKVLRIKRIPPYTKV